MSDTTNGTTEAKPESALDKLHKQWVAGGKKKPDQKTAGALMKAYSTAHGKKLEAEKAYEAAMAAEQDAARAIVLARGKGRFTGPDGTMYTAMSKGDSVFLRVDGGKDLDSFG